MLTEKPESLPVEQFLINLKASPLFWFIKDSSFESLIQIQHQRVNRVINLSTSENELKLLFEAETLAANPERKLNEDAFLAIPMGKGKALFAVLDGVSSQMEIAGLSQFGIKGAFYVSHLVALGFPNSSVHQELRSREILTATDVLKSINVWLHEQMQRIEGVDYTDPLSIPGMAATFALVDSKKGEVTIAHTADTLACVCYRNGDIKILTPNQNEKFDQETLEFARALARKEGCTLVDLIKAPVAKATIKEQLKSSFIRKINTPGGCGILNGMSALVENSLVFETSIEITQDIDSVFLFSDGALIPFSEGRNLGETTALIIKKFQSPQLGVTVLEEGAKILENDSGFQKIPRLKLRDDATFLRIAFGKENW